MCYEITCVSVGLTLIVSCFCEHELLEKTCRADCDICISSNITVLRLWRSSVSRHKTLPSYSKWAKCKLWQPPLSMETSLLCLLMWTCECLIWTTTHRTVVLLCLHWDQITFSIYWNKKGKLKLISCQGTVLFCFCFFYVRMYACVKAVVSK